MYFFSLLALPLGSSVPDSAYEDPDEDTFRIIVATDNHLGYKEDDQIRKDDSFDAFDECFRIARERKAEKRPQGQSRVRGL